MWRISRHTAARLKRMVLFAFKRALAKALRLRFLFETSSQRPKLFSRAPLQSTEVFALLSLHMWRFRTQGRNAPNHQVTYRRVWSVEFICSAAANATQPSGPTMLPSRLRSSWSIHPQRSSIKNHNELTRGRSRMC